MRKKLSLELRRELLTRTAEDYASARKGIKSQIVDQLVAATGYDRKHAITLLNHPPGSVSSLRPSLVWSLTSEIESQSRPVAPPEGRETGLAPVALRAPSPRPVVSEARNQ